VTTTRPPSRPGIACRKFIVAARCAKIPSVAEDAGDRPIHARRQPKRRGSNRKSPAIMRSKQSADFSPGFSKQISSADFP
jgi:hypothetical protein